MKLSTFARTERFVPKTLGNDKSPATDQFYFDLDTVSVDDYFTLNAVMLNARSLSDAAQQLPEKSAERALKSQEAAHGVVKGFGPIAAKYVRVSNLFDQGGAPVTMEDILKYPIFGETVLEVMQHLLGISTPDEAATGN